MNGSQAQFARENGYERVMPAFKRHILEMSAGFESEPEADLYRINLLGMMLERYDALREKSLSEPVCVKSVMQEFSDIPARMREAGFAENGVHEDTASSRWPMMTEAEVDAYIRESDAYLHRRSMGVGLCTASIAPLMIGAGLSEVFLSDFFALLGLAGMIAVIGMGVYAIVTAAAPKEEKKIRKGEFSLSARVRRKLASFGDAVEEKARKRKGKGIASIVISMIPMFIGVAFADVFSSDLWVSLGLAGMFVMIGAGVYQLVLGDGEKKCAARLMKSDE